MDAIVTISGGGIIGNYISSRLNNLNIKCVVVEKNQRGKGVGKKLIMHIINFSKSIHIIG